MSVCGVAQPPPNDQGWCGPLKIVRWLRRPELDPLAWTSDLRWPWPPGEDVAVPAPHPAEFRRRAVELARRGETLIAALAKQLSISESCLRNWMAQADADADD